LNIAPVDEEPVLCEAIIALYPLECGFGRIAKKRLAEIALKVG